MHLVFNSRDLATSLFAAFCVAFLIGPVTAAILDEPPLTMHVVRNQGVYSSSVFDLALFLQQSQLVLPTADMVTSWHG